MRAIVSAFMATWIAIGCGPATPSSSPVEADGRPARSPPLTKSPSPMPLTGLVDEETFARLHTLRADAAPPSRGTAIEIAGSQAYLSLPEGASAPLPGIIVIHEWWGLNEHIRHWTDRLAEDGYAALAVDLYGGAVATDRERAMQLMKSVDPERAQEILNAAHEFLGQDPRVSAPKRGVIGWCFGGGWSLTHAITRSDLDAAVIYYGRLVDDPEVLAGIEAALLGVFGERDQGIPPSSVEAFVAALRKAGKTIEIHRYDAEHAFANPSSANYDTEAAADAWSHVRAFFERELR